MSQHDIYRELAKKVGTENSPIVRRIWETVCTPEEARLLNSLPAATEELIRHMEMTMEAVEAMLAVLFHKGLVFKARKDGKTLYRMPRHIIQFHDATALWPEAPPQLLELWRQYTLEEFPQIPAALTAMKAPSFFRVVPINEKIEAQSQVLAYEDAARIVENASVLAVTKCPCRMIMRKCDKPIDVCLQINRGAEYAIERGTGRKIDVDEASAILRRSEDAGLVHLTENKAGIGTVICNCCNCCCIALPYKKDAATGGMLVPSRYGAVVNDDDCTGCCLCLDACPMGAIGIEDNMASVNAETCIGCGVCSRICPTAAIGLVVVRQEDYIPA